MSNAGQYAYGFDAMPTCALSSLDAYTECKNEAANYLLFTALGSIDFMPFLKADVQLNQLGPAPFYNKEIHRMTGGVRIETIYLTDGKIT